MIIKIRYLWKGRWFYIDFFKDNLGLKFKEFEARHKTTKLELWTGLLDKNKKKIFEGDIVKVIWQSLKERKADGYEDNINYYLGLVNFGYVFVDYTEKKVPCFYVERFFPKDYKKEDSKDIVLEYKNTEVIGNKFENPELIK